MNRKQLVESIKQKKSLLCVGLDSDIRKIPKHLLSLENPVHAFNKAIVEVTSEFTVAYKPNIAFYESEGVQGWQSLENTMREISANAFTIADAKRGDIGNTSGMYARTFFDKFSFDAVTVSPYMGSDSVKPFLEFNDKWVIILALTSNPGAGDFQMEKLVTGEYLYQRVLRNASSWGTSDNIMFVVGATRGEMFTEVRKIVPDHFLLVPGVGAQGGDIEEVCKYGMNRDGGLLINASRSIIYASSGEDFADKAREEAKKLQHQMQHLMELYMK